MFQFMPDESFNESLKKQIFGFAASSAEEEPVLCVVWYFILSGAW